MMIIADIILGILLIVEIVLKCYTSRKLKDYDGVGKIHRKEYDRGREIYLDL